MYFLLNFIFLYVIIFFWLLVVNRDGGKNYLKLILQALFSVLFIQIITTISTVFFFNKPAHDIFQQMTTKPRLSFILKYFSLSLFFMFLRLINVKVLVENKSVNKSTSRFYLFSSFLMFGFSFFIMSIFYLYKFFPTLTLDQILFTLAMPLRGTNAGLIFWSIILLFVIPIVVAITNYALLKTNKILYCSIYKFKFKFKILPFKFKYCKSILLFFVIGFVSFFLVKLDVAKFIKYSLQEDSNFYEENYIDPKMIDFVFPEKKKNLILIYLESMEADAAQYANKDSNIMPELTELANSNISFSHNSGLGGQAQVIGTGWSLASLCCTTLGVPLTLPIGGNNYEYTKHFFNGAYGLGDLLADNGYNLSFIMGADSEFGGLKALLETHGFTIKSLEYFRKIGKVPKDYFVWWGIEDKKVIEYAKEELLELWKTSLGDPSISKTGKPFMFSVFLEDTHNPSGYMDEDCQRIYKKQIHNVYSNMSKRVNNFVNWIKQQPFYEDTVIVILGDHLYMGDDLYDVQPPRRHAYNAFINTNLSDEYSKNRDFATFDFFPCIVESLGIKYDADGLGLGRSLFSGKQTLLEKLGEEKLNECILSKSNFYINELLN